MTLIAQYHSLQGIELMSIIFYLLEACTYQDVTEIGKTCYFIHHHRYFENYIDYDLSKLRINIYYKCDSILFFLIR